MGEQAVSGRRPAGPADLVNALLLAAAVLLGGLLLAQQVENSAIYRKSRIITSIFTEESVGVWEMVADARNRETLTKFVGAVANAYISFEFIPLGEAATFTAVYESMGPVVEIDRFDYQRRTLVITGSSPDENGYYEFLRRLRGKEQFESVSGHFYTATDDTLRFEIQCVPASAAGQGYLELFGLD